MADRIIQVFGFKKCAVTRKAERWFKERGKRLQVIELSEKGMTKGEVTSVARNAGGIDALIDREGRRYADKGLKYSGATGDRVLALLLEDPLLFKTPIVRCGSDATVGFQPDIWEQWFATAVNSPNTK